MDDLDAYDANEAHDVGVPARPEVVFAAVKKVDLREVRLLVPLNDAAWAGAAARAAPRLPVGAVGAGAPTRP